MPKLRDSGRLGTVASMVPRGSHVADIGSGHGRLALRLLATGRARSCIATERAGGAGRALSAAPLREGLEVRIGDGLSVLDSRDRIDVLVLCGMGSRSMVRILDGWRERAPGLRKLVLQPQGEWAFLRRWLWDHEMKIVEERMIRQGRRFYLILAAIPDVPELPPEGALLGTTALMEVGPCLVRSGDPVVRRFWELQLRRLERIVGRANGPGWREAARRKAVTSRILRVLDSREDRPSDPLL